MTLEDTFAALDLPWSDETAQRMSGVSPNDVWRQAHRLLSDSLVESLWSRWHPARRERLENPRFRLRLRRLLASGLQMGYRLERFRDCSASLPDPDDGGRNWIATFEETLSADDCCRMRMFVSRAQDASIRSPNRSGADAAESWDTLMSTMHSDLFYELGLVFPTLAFAVDDQLEAPWYRCEWNDLRLPPRRGIDQHSALVNDTVERLKLLGISGVTATHPATGADCAIIDISAKAKSEEAGLTTWDQQGYLVLALTAAVRDAAAALVNRSLVQLYLLRLRDFFPELIAAIERAFEVDFLVQVLRGLLAEQISIRNLAQVFQAMLELRAILSEDLQKYIVFVPPTGGVFLDGDRRRLEQLGPADYVEFVRGSFKRYISHKYTRGQNTLSVYLIDPKAETRLTGAEEVDEATAASILKAVRTEIGSLPPTGSTPVVLTISGVRPRLRRLVAPDFPRLAVLSYQELSPDMNIQPIARIAPDFDDDQ